MKPNCGSKNSSSCQKHYEPCKQRIHAVITIQFRDNLNGAYSAPATLTYDPGWLSDELMTYGTHLLKPFSTTANSPWLESEDLVGQSRWVKWYNEHMCVCSWTPQRETSEEGTWVLVGVLVPIDDNALQRPSALEEGVSITINLPDWKAEWIWWP